MLSARTRPGRLAALDRWLAHERPQLLSSGATLIDFGYGESPVTTEEWAARASACRVIGIDLRERKSDKVTLIRGDVDACAQFAPITVLRAMNVARSYSAEDVPRLHAVLGAGVIEGGLVIEGSTDTDGTVLCAWLLRKRDGALHREALLTWTDFSRGFSPWLFRDWLPRELRRSVKKGTAIHDALTRWEARCVGESARARFDSSIGDDVAATGWERDNGYARLTLPRAP